MTSAKGDDLKLLKVVRAFLKLSTSTMNLHDAVSRLVPYIPSLRASSALA